MPNRWATSATETSAPATAATASTTWMSCSRRCSPTTSAATCPAQRRDQNRTSRNSAGPPPVGSSAMAPSLCVRFAHNNACDMHISTGSRRAAGEAAFAALLLGMLLAQLDGTVVVAALPTITADLGEPGAVAGVSAAYLLTVTVSTPVHGRLGDLLGRRAVFVGALLVFAAGSALCAAAPTFPTLVAARALQGIGGGGLVVSAVTGLGGLFGPAGRIRRQVWVTAVFGVSALAGPPVGALLAAGPGWRWVFLANLPLCAVALALGGRGLPGRRPATTPGFDLLGTLLVVAGGSCAVALGSVDGLPARVAVPLAAGAVLAGALFVLVERRAPAPLVPPALF